MSVIETKCAKCKFYEKLSDTGGACCYNPPTVIVQGEDGGVVNSAFPKVGPENRCGKFEPAPEV